MTDALNLFSSDFALVVGLGAILVGAVVQGSLGFGMGLVSIPILALMVPERLPQALVIASVPHTILMLARERHGLRPRALSWLVVGRLAGIVPGIAILAVASARSLQVLFACVTLAAVGLMSMDRLALRITPLSQLAAGTLSGFGGAAAGLGGPPVALLYADQDGPALRTTLSAIMLAGNAVMILGYALTDRLTPIDVWTTLLFTVPVLSGLAIGMAVRSRLDGPRLRVAVLVLVFASGLVLLVRAVFG